MTAACVFMGFVLIIVIVIVFKEDELIVGNGKPPERQKSPQRLQGIN